jgi:hypothetical protein
MADGSDGDTLRFATTDADLAAIVDVVGIVSPEDHASMRAVNARLGYRPLPDEVFMRGPLFTGPGP